MIGRNQNAGGDIGVVLLNANLTAGLINRGAVVEVQQPGGEWTAHRPGDDLQASPRIRSNGTLLCDFTSGGNRPDITASRAGRPILVGEVKGRKDLLNVWESWMPQVADHARSWRRQYPDVAPLFFGTVVNREMIEGQSMRGTRHAGLKGLYEDGDLPGIYNLSNLAAHQPYAEQTFSALITWLGSLL